MRIHEAASRLKLDPGVRGGLASRVLDCLRGAAPGSTAKLRGSLAEGRADAFSDIDVLWEIPDEFFQETIARTSEILSEVRPVVSLRSDPDFQNSDRRRLFFVEFHGMPLFWWVDVDILARSVRGNLEYDRQNPAARGDDWSLTHSALMNVVAAVKAVLRNKEGEAEGIMARGFQRVGLTVPEGRARELVLKLTDSVTSIDPSMGGLVRRIEELHQEAFG